jgi:hypothetical protein
MLLRPKSLDPLKEVKNLMVDPRYFLKQHTRDGLLNRQLDNRAPEYHRTFCLD